MNLKIFNKFQSFKKKENVISLTTFSKLEQFFQNKKKVNLMTIFLEIPFLNNLFISSSFPKFAQPEDLMTLQEKKSQKNLNLNLGDYLLFSLVFTISSFKKKKISRAKILFFSQLKMFFKFPEFYHDLGQFIHLLLKIISIQLRSFFLFFLLASPKEEKKKKESYVHFLGKKFSFFSLFQEIFQSSLVLFLDFAKQTNKQSLGQQFEFLKSINHNLRKRSFRKFYLKGFIYLFFFLEAEKPSRGVVSFFSNFPILNSKPFYISNSFLSLIYPEFYYQSLIKSIKNKTNLTFFPDEVGQIFFLNQRSPEFSRKNRIEWIRDLQTLKSFQKKIFCTLRNKKRKEPINYRKKNYRNIFRDYNFSFFASRILLAIKLDS